MGLTSSASKLARSPLSLKRLKAQLDAGEAKRVVGSTPMTVREPVGHAAHQRPPLTTR